MKKKKRAKHSKKKAPDVHKHLRKLPTRKHIDDIVFIFREYMKEFYHIPISHTFEEINKTISKKHIEPKLKGDIAEICEIMEDMQYRKTKPRGRQLTKIKKDLKEIMHVHTKKQPQTKAVLKKLEKEKKKEKHHSILKRVTTVKKDIEKKIVSKTKKKPKVIVEDDETKEIKEFIKTSLELGVNKTKLRKELKSMGFSTKKIEHALSLV